VGGTVVQVRRDSLAPTQGGDPGLAPEAFQHDPDLLLRRVLLAGHPADFERRLRLPEAVNAAKAEATMENGLLTLRLPIAEEAKAKTIKVRAC